jgi:hypothetical protein
MMFAVARPMPLATAVMTATLSLKRMAPSFVDAEHGTVVRHAQADGAAPASFWLRSAGRAFDSAERP